MWYNKKLRDLLCSLLIMGMSLMVSLRLSEELKARNAESGGTEGR